MSGEHTPAEWLAEREKLLTELWRSLGFGESAPSPQYISGNLPVLRGRYRELLDAWRAERRTPL